jgi:hypothetical protein
MRAVGWVVPPASPLGMMPPSPTNDPPPPLDEAPPPLVDVPPPELDPPEEELSAPEEPPEPDDEALEGEPKPYPEPLFVPQALSASATAHAKAATQQAIPSRDVLMGADSIQRSPETTITREKSSNETRANGNMQYRFQCWGHAGLSD